MKVQKDKIQHFTINVLVSYVTAIIIYSHTRNDICAMYAGFFNASGLSIGKEYGDKNANGNHWCWWDLLADYIGNVIGLLLFYLTAKFIY